jgi:hypothetical protein
MEANGPTAIMGSFDPIRDKDLKLEIVEGGEARRRLTKTM